MNTNPDGKSRSNKTAGPRKKARIFPRTKLGQHLLGITLFWGAGLLALFFLWYGYHGVVADSIFIAGKYRGAYVHGIPAWFVAAFYYCISAFLIAFIIRYRFDPSPERPFYPMFYKCLKYICWGIGIGFLAAAILTSHKR
jgi:hypothetical protein